MAYIQFSVTSIETSLKDSSITICCSHDVDAATVTEDRIILTNKETHEVADYTADVDGKIITLKLRNNPKVNSTYNLIIQDTIKDIVDDPLEASLFRHIVFKSEVVSNVAILSPADFEVISSPSFKWKETADKAEGLTGLYRLQIATENAFYHIECDTVITAQTEADLPNKVWECQTELASLDDGQHYVRIRPENGEEYGDWSPVRTFMLRKGEKKESDPSPSSKEKETDDGGISFTDLTVADVKLEGTLTLIIQPENGETPEQSFTYLFDQAIDASNASATIIRSDF